MRFSTQMQNRDFKWICSQRNKNNFQNKRNSQSQMWKCEEYAPVKCAGHQQKIGSPTYCLVVMTRENISSIDVVCLRVSLSTKSSSFLNFTSFMLKISLINFSTIVRYLFQQYVWFQQPFVPPTTKQFSQRICKKNPVCNNLDQLFLEIIDANTFFPIFNQKQHASFGAKAFTCQRIVNYSWLHLMPRWNFFSFNILGFFSFNVVFHNLFWQFSLFSVDNAEWRSLDPSNRTHAVLIGQLRNACILREKFSRGIINLSISSPIHCLISTYARLITMFSLFSPRNHFNTFRCCDSDQLVIPLWITEHQIRFSSCPQVTPCMHASCNPKQSFVCMPALSHWDISNFRSHVEKKIVQKKILSFPRPNEITNRVDELRTWRR